MRKRKTNRFYLILATGILIVGVVYEFIITI